MKNVKMEKRENHTKPEDIEDTESFTPVVNIIRLLGQLRAAKK